jgi:nicotinamidase/pyrazinamidase
VKSALLLVDIQNDFMPDGALPVPDGDAVVPVANRLQAGFELIVASQDWHPPDHGSFASNHPGAVPYDTGELAGLPQTFWPDHCVQETTGAAFVEAFDTARVDRVFRKGTDPEIDSYSAFFDNGRRKATGLGDYLLERGVEELTVAGVATDYCVLFSVLDARRLGLRTRVVAEGCRGVGVQPGDVDEAWAAMRDAGAEIV